MARPVLFPTLLLASLVIGCAGSPVSSAPDLSKGDAGSPVDGGASCDPVTLESAPSDQLLLVDVSQSWSTKFDRWQGATDALAAHVTGSEATRALTYFPNLEAGGEDACDSAAYASLDLDWGVTKDQLTTSFSSVSLRGQSPLGEALTGAITTARERPSPGRTRSVVLVTDATPSDDESCSSKDWEKVASVAAAGLDRGRSDAVHVHVISVMGRAVSSEHFGRLGAIAGMSGYAAFVNGSRTDVRNATLDALADIDTRMRVCSRLLPTGLNPETLTFRFSDGSTHEVNRVADADACAAGKGFYVDNPDHPSIATVCSGDGGVGGLCELLMVKATMLGDPTAEAPTCEK